MDGSSWTKNLMNAVKVILGLGAAVGALAVVLIVAPIIAGFLDNTATGLSLPATATAIIANVTNGLYDFINAIVTGLGVVGGIIPVVIVVTVFAVAGYLGYTKLKGGKGGSY